MSKWNSLDYSVVANDSITASTTVTQFATKRLLTVGLLSAPTRMVLQDRIAIKNTGLSVTTSRVQYWLGQTFATAQVISDSGPIVLGSSFIQMTNPAELKLQLNLDLITPNTVSGNPSNFIADGDGAVTFISTTVPLTVEMLNAAPFTFLDCTAPNYIWLTNTAGAILPGMSLLLLDSSLDYTSA